jgi:hypothetical protein
VSRAEDEVLRLQRVCLQIVEFVDVPQALNVNVFELVAAQGMERGRVREIALPIIFVEQGFTPRHRLALGQRDETFSIQAIGRPQAAGLEDRRRDVEERNLPRHHARGHAVGRDPQGDVLRAVEEEAAVRLLLGKRAGADVVVRGEAA